MGASARASALIVVNCAAGATRKVSSYDVFSTRSLLREATFPVSSKKSRPHDLARAYRGAHVHARARVQVASVLIRSWGDRVGCHFGFLPSHHLDSPDFSRDIFIRSTLVVEKYAHFVYLA